MDISPDKTYRFTKSGNLVRTIAATSYGGRGNWIVARIDTGKEMVVAGKALVSQSHPDWS
ncbi:hypothetical protein [Pseudomonas putida]|uniref:Uncharacterized protein n=1 Tax=Pseudomonas putida TaxID=303 RepID=A0A7V8J460_PSEPU|nr:hypothetical protein [Pseudomonas putida]KAF0254329.1 hypothetical protein GN299_13825 [Pseudomonas putida]